MDAITWPVAASILGTLVVVATFISSHLRAKSMKPWSDDLSRSSDNIRSQLRNAEHRVTVAEGKIDDLIRRAEELKREINQTNISTEKKIEKIEEKLEKMTELVIDILHNVK